ncbi:related to FK506 suppressor Sfk1 [Fusarium torulosum]|uniref:Related to FK506 suppressor Sfk1 n=1 Tax=Fusarium torulosum TaxID=33205 RepID=A0AAE8SFY7_9HYPO|nr:related to FK506 suppressor Sfk1 [Fusarium torulosum]
MAVKGVFSYWWFPVISGLVWLGMLLGLLLEWQVNQNGRRYPTQSRYSDIAYISNVGADRLQPLFIVGCVLTSIFLDAAFLSERWLRHRGRLAPNTTLMEKILSGLSIIFATVGTVGLICLSIFKTGKYSRLHNTFLALFIGGYLISAVFICWEYQRLGINYREHRVLRLSFWVKLTFILVELALIIAFGVCSRVKARNAAAILEWVISFIFTFYAVSFVIDLYPAVRTKGPDKRFQKTGFVPSALSDSRSPSNASHSNLPTANGRRDVEMAQNGPPPRDF